MCPSTLCSPLIGDGGHHTVCLRGQRFFRAGCKDPHGLGLAGALEWVVAPRFLLELACVFYKE